MKLVSKVLAILSVGLLASSSAQADECKRIDTLISTTLFTAGCTSPVGFCTAGTVFSGPLAGTTRFEVLQMTPGATPYQFLYQGQLVITTRHGTLTVRDYGLVDFATQRYFELQQVVSGTGGFENATGTLTSNGSTTATGFFGTLTGTVCRGGDQDGAKRSE